MQMTRSASGARAIALADIARRGTMALAARRGSESATMFHRIPIIVYSVASIVSSSAPARNAKPMRALRDSIVDASDSPNSGTNAYARMYAATVMACRARRRRRLRRCASTARP
jgi:hypothetical protein